MGDIVELAAAYAQRTADTTYMHLRAATPRPPRFAMRTSATVRHWRARRDIESEAYPVRVREELSVRTWTPPLVHYVLGSVSRRDVRPKLCSRLLRAVLQGIGQTNRTSVEALTLAISTLDAPAALVVVVEALRGQRLGGEGTAERKLLALSELFPGAAMNETLRRTIVALPVPLRSPRVEAIPLGSTQWGNVMVRTNEELVLACSGLGIVSHYGAAASGGSVEYVDMPSTGTLLVASRDAFNVRETFVQARRVLRLVRNDSELRFVICTLVPHHIRLGAADDARECDTMTIDTALSEEGLGWMTLDQLRREHESIESTFPVDAAAGQLVVVMYVLGQLLGSESDVSTYLQSRRLILVPFKSVMSDCRVLSGVARRSPVPSDRSRRSPSPPSASTH
jgi:hypothetical protein